MAAKPEALFYDIVTYPSGTELINLSHKHFGLVRTPSNMDF